MRCVVFLVGIQLRFGDADLGDRFVRIIEERKKLVVFLLRDLVVFVRVAARAPNSETEPDAAGGFGAVEHGFHAVLLLINSAFAVGEGLPVECCRENLLRARLLEQVSSKLFDRESVEWKVFVHGLDDPIPVSPCIEAGVVFFVSVAIGVASLIKPVASPAFAKMGGC